ncbi:MAG: ABC transporter permease [Deltaproteobacteria bacterium]
MGSAIRRSFVAFLAGIRSLRRRPSYAVVSILLLGTSSGALFLSAAIVDALLVRPPSARAAHELLAINSPLPEGAVSRPNYVDLAQRNTTLAGLVAYGWAARVVVQAGSFHLESLCQAVSPNFFSTLGLSPVRGRFFRAEDDVSGSEPVVLMTEALLHRLELEIGTLVRVNTQPFRIIGTLPDDYQALDRRTRPELWIPLAHVVPTYAPPWLLDGPTTRSTVWLRLAGRLRPNVSPDAAREELNALAQQIQREHPDVVGYATFSVTSLPAARFSYDPRARTMLLLGGSVVALFLLALTNFFLLTLVRSALRRQEIALRLALGASTGDIAAWLAGELATLLTLGLATGLGWSALALQWLESTPEVGAWLPAAAVSLDLRSGTFVVGIACAAATLVWLLACPRSGSHDLYLALKNSGSPLRRQRRLLRLLAGELGLALLLLSLSFAAVDALNAAAARPVPIRTEGVLLADVALAQLGWSNDYERPKVFYQELVDRLRSTPGVIDVALADRAPFAGFRYTNVFVGDVDPRLAPDKCTALFSDVGPDYFAALGLSLAEGRGITEADQVQKLYLPNGSPSGKQNVAIVNRAMARRFWPDQDSPLGQDFLPWEGGSSTTVIGVVERASPADPQTPEGPQFYLPFMRESLNATVVVHVAGDSPATRQRLTDQLLPWWPLPEPPAWRSMQQQVEGGRSGLRTSVRVLLWIALFSSAVAGSGVYFFSAFTAMQTLRDTALRLALGATWQHLIQLHLQRVARSAALGVALGSALVYACRPIFSRLDVSIESPTPLHLAWAAAPLAVITMLGSFVPFLRLRRLDICRVLAKD